MAEPEKSFTDYLKSYVGLNNKPETDVEEPSQLDIFGIPLGSTLDDANLNLESFTLPMTASGSDQKISEDDAGHPVFRSKLDGSTYTIMYKEDQRTDLIKIKEDVIPAVKEYAEDPYLPTGEQVVDATKAVAGSIYDTISIPGDVASGERNLSDVTMGDVYGIAGSGGAMSTLGRAPANSLRMFGGANALAPITKGPFSKAEEMSAKGARPQKTWKETGWWLDDVDGKWRFEIDDSEATLPEAMIKTDADGEYLMDTDVAYNDTWSDPDSIYFDSEGPKPLAYDAEYNGEFHGPGSSVWKLGDLLKHDKLFKNYPELKNQIVVLNAQFDDPNILGEYNPKTGTHKISEQISDPDAIRSTLLHEIQHAVQSREGFAPGTNLDVAIDFNLKGFLDEKREVYKSLNIAPPPKSTNSLFNLIQSSVNSVVQLETTLKKLNITLADDVKKAAVKKLKKIDNERDTFLKKRDEASREYYYNESGEIESRLTQARQYFDQGMREDLSPVDQKTRIIRDSPIAEKRFSWPYNKMTAQNNFEQSPTYGVMDKKLVLRPNVTDIVLKLDPEYDINAFGTNSGGWIYEGKKFKDYEEIVDLSVREFLNKTKDTKKVSKIKPGDVFKDKSGNEFVFRNFRRFDKETSDLNPTLPQIIFDRSGSESFDLNEKYLEIIGANVIKLDNFTKSQRLDAIEHAKDSLYVDPPETIGIKNNSTITLGDMVFDSSLSKLKPTETAGLRPRGYSSTNSIGFAGGGSVNTMENQMKMFEEGGIADDGMSRDPVSGNNIPSGSLAEEVRDDIPAQLSEGEYVVPADVVRYFGVRVFEDMRMEAKMGLQKMEQDGRIGGEPINTPAVRSNTDDLSPEEQKLLQEIMAMEQPQEQPAGFAPGGYAGTLGGSYIGSNTDSIFSPTKTQDQFKTLGGSYLQTGSTGAPTMEGGVESVAPVVNKVCPPGQIFSEKSQMCIISPGAYKDNDDDGGNNQDLPEPEDWGADVDWTNSEGMLGYVSSVLTPMDPMLEKGLQIGGALTGGFLGFGVAALPLADSLNDLSNARATSLIARAMGDNTTADAIDAQIDAYAKKAPKIATSWLGNWLSSGTSRAGYLARKAGFDSLEDAAANPDAFRKALGGTTTEVVKDAVKTTTTSNVGDRTGAVTYEAPTVTQMKATQKEDKSSEREAARARASSITDEKARTGQSVQTIAKRKDKEKSQSVQGINDAAKKKKDDDAAKKSGATRGAGGEFGRNRGGLIKKRKKKK